MKEQPILSSLKFKPNFQMLMHHKKSLVYTNIYIHTLDTHTHIHMSYIQSNFSMDETPTQVISKIEVDNLLQSSGDVVATITALGKLVTRLFQQNTVLVAQLAELKSAGVTKESPCVSNVTIMEHEINILNVQLKVMYMKLGNERESAKQERISKMKIISLLKGRIKKMADKQIPRSPPTKHMSWQPFQQESRKLQEASPMVPTFNLPDPANLNAVTPMKPSSPSMTRLHSFTGASVAAVVPAKPSPTYAQSLAVKTLNSKLKQKIMTDPKNTCMQCEQVLFHQEVTLANMKFVEFTSGTTCLTCDALCNMYTFDDDI